jgi:hypothetical protein
MKSSRLLIALCALFPVAAWSDPVHNVWATSPLVVADASGSYTATSANCSFSWNENTLQAFANARATTASGDVYAFQLVSVTANTTSSEIIGTWNVSKNGVALCTRCEGSAYGLGGGVGSYFKIYVGNSTYHLSARVTSAYDY